MESERKRNGFCVVIFMFFLMSVITSAEAHTILVEAENFEDTGGWVIDQQFMDQMGSPFLLAHGLGQPVKDATTAVTFPAAGTYLSLIHISEPTRPY